MTLRTTAALVLAVPLALAACDGSGAEAPQLRFTAAAAPAAAHVVGGDTVRFSRTTYDSLQAAGAELPPFPVSVAPGGVRIEGYYLALTSGAPPEGRVYRDGDAVVVEVATPDEAILDMTVPYLYTAEVAVPTDGPTRVRVVHEGDGLRGRGGEPVVVLDRVVGSAAQE